MYTIETLLHDIIGYHYVASQTVTLNSGPTDLWVLGGPQAPPLFGSYHVAKLVAMNFITVFLSENSFEYG